MVVTDEVIQAKARELLHTELQPMQLHWVQALLAGEVLKSTAAGFTPAYRVYFALKKRAP